MFPLKPRCWSGLVLASAIGVNTVVTIAAEPPVRDALYRPQEAPVRIMHLPSQGPAPVDYAIIRGSESRPKSGARWWSGPKPIRVQTVTTQRELSPVTAESNHSLVTRPIMPLFAE
ncbi:hypothetical protein [Rubinisphaera margarita]|uniref:hypothetical protein n=1 Tax=Rubinisphaera margarita TaxID=2909586 RepID=UPI001EE97813|nr:hypothetical protein [Rubinisphaera margarita]MCG6156790.1 hypothetical protein [Rubinisphaera margarita]